MKGLFLSCVIVIAGCGSSTKLTDSWKHVDNQAKKFNNIAVVTLFPSSSNRYLMENSMKDAFKEKKITAKATYDIFPMAGKLGDVEIDDEAKAKLKSKVEQKITDNKFDGILIITLLQKDVQQRYEESKDFHWGGTSYYGTPYSGGSFYDYYAYSFGSIYRSGYYVDDVTYFVDCKFYDVKTEELLWSGQTKTVNLKDMEEETIRFSHIIVKDLLDKKVIVP